MKILFLAPRYPFPAERGDQRRVLHLVEELGQRAIVTLVCFGEGALAVDGVTVIGLHRSTLGTVRANLVHPALGLPLQVRLYLDHGMARAVASELEAEPYDVVHATTARLAPYLPDPSSGVHRHLDLIDALSVNMATRAARERGLNGAVFRVESALLRAYESAAVAASDSASLVSEADRAAAPGLEHAVVIPNGVDVDRFPFRPPVDRPSVLLFFGNLGYFHNVEPARFVAREVIARVRGEVPDARLRIVGARPSKAVLELDGLPGVDVVGPVPDIAAELHAAAVAVVPMFTGSGIKNKVLESFSSGTPVVTNAQGIQGVEGAEDRVHFRQAEGAAGLAAACVEALLDAPQSERLAAAARMLVERRYTWAAQAERLLELYRSGRI